MTNIVDISEFNITVGHPNRTIAKINLVGNLKLTNNVVLFDVLVIPKYTVSLLSVNKMIKDSKLHVGFNKHDCVIQDLKKENVLGTGSESSGLYMFDIDCNLSKVKSNFSILCCHVSKSIWHNRVTSREGYKYFLTIVDDFSREVWVYLIKSKDEVFGKLTGERGRRRKVTGGEGCRRKIGSRGGRQRKRDSVGLKSQPKRAFHGQPLGLTSDQEVELNVGNYDLTKSVFRALQIDETDLFSFATSNETITSNVITGVRGSRCVYVGEVLTTNVLYSETDDVFSGGDALINPTAINECTTNSTHNMMGDEASLSNNTSEVHTIAGITSQFIGMMNKLVDSSNIAGPSNIPNEMYLKETLPEDGVIPSQDTPIVQSAFINLKPISYAGFYKLGSYARAASVRSFEPKKGKANFHTLELENLCEGVKLTILIQVV
nr:ribonuclease H-like domain-containing protein [Tanacetum cinerariifolium]